MQQQINFLDTLFGKMSPEHSQATMEKISRQSSKRSAPSVKKTLMFLDLRPGMGGNLLGAYWEMDTVLPGEYMTLNTGECPNVVRESTLSQILQQNAPEKYSLSPIACAGIIRRAEKREKELPDMLREALMETIGLAGGLTNIEEEPEKPEDWWPGQDENEPEEESEDEFDEDI